MGRRLPDLILVVLFSTLSYSSAVIPSSGSTAGRINDAQDNKAWIYALRQSQFSPIPHRITPVSCEISEPPEALATPDPMVELSGPTAAITVSFIVGTDGRVHSLFILDSEDASEDRTVLTALRSWRYRPAKCNGVPIDAEARIQFRQR